MAIRDKMAKNVAPHLRPGETIQVVFGAQTHNPYLVFLLMLPTLPFMIGSLTDDDFLILVSFPLMMLSVSLILLLSFKKTFRVVAVTDSRILVCRAGLNGTSINEVLAELSRTTQIGPASGMWWRCETLGERMYVAKRFLTDVAAADGAMPQAR